VTAPGAPLRRRVGGRLRRWDSRFDATGSVRAWALLRFTIAPLVFIHLRPFLRLMDADTWYRDRFHESWVSWYPEVGKGTYFWLLRLCLVAAVLASLGIATRVTTTYTAAFVAWNLFLTTTNYHHNRAFLALVLTGIATAPSGRVLSVDAWVRRRRHGGRPPVDDAPLWPLWLLRFELACVYGGSGLSKLLDDDWRGGTVTWDRVLKSRSQLARSPLPQWFIDLISRRDFHTGFAKVVILTELFIALGLWWRATRLAAVWTAVWFHVFIEISAHVQVFSYAGIAALVIWTVPRTRDRVVVRAGPGLAAAVRWLDWLGRFRVEARAAPGPVTLLDRDGRRYEGTAATWRVLSRLPATFLVAGPLVAGSFAKKSLTARRDEPQTEHSSVNLVQ
jgi:hypothetical protein